ncbi:MAG: hypothetical protein MJ135_04360 [Oscillospiraceae bacterium]|nr:hypothetical protein [Oscillospiraceae bacterium]
MVLEAYREEEMWITSRWSLTYPAGWEQILKGVSAVYDFYDQPQLLVMNRAVSVKNAKDILALSESMNLTIRGNSRLVKTPVQIRFYNQLAAVDVSVPMLTEEFRNVSYESLSRSLGKYLDSIELAMHR